MTEMPPDQERDDTERPSPSAPLPARRSVSPTTLAALVIFLVGTSLRLWIAARNVSTPMIDENEVVEQAVAFMGPDHRHFFLKYGPLTMYVLAGIYRVAAWLHDSTAIEHASRVFFEGDEFYLIARFYLVGWLSILALAAFASFRRHFGAGPALLVLGLLAFPLLELLAPGARIDLAQAAFQCLALLALGEVVTTGRLVHWLLAGACAGLAVATKPLPGLLLAPCFLAASWFHARLAPDGSSRNWRRRLGAALGSRGMWLSALAVGACALLGNPAMLDVQRFVTSQREAIALHSGNTLNARHDIDAIFLRLGLPFVITGIASAALAVALREPRALLLLLFIVVYVAAFYGRAATPYFMVAPAAAACLLIGHAWVTVGALGERWLARRARHGGPGEGEPTPSERWRRVTRWAWAPLWALLAALPSTSLYRIAQRPNLIEQAEQWFYANVPSGTRVFWVGWRPSGPRLVASSEKIQAKWGDHFDYGRDKYAFLKQAFHLGFERYIESDKPRYALSVHDDVPHSRASKRTPRSITDGLLDEARKKQIAYIILAGYREPRWQDLDYRWFGAATLAAEFGRIAIFKVSVQAPAPPTSTAATQESR
jgi:hypothetical protein